MLLDGITSDFGHLMREISENQTAGGALTSAHLGIL
jgi:hypothetical protein